MSKVFISRSDGTIPWGFRLQGGLEYNEPLILTNIQPNSPADGKIDPGDMIIEIAGTNVTHMTHKDALELIQRCGNALFMTLYKVDHSYPTGANQTRRFSEQLPYNYGQSSYPIGNIPQAPIFDVDLITRTAASLRNQQEPIDEIHSSYEHTTEFSDLPAVLAKSFGRSGGPKPFTYTPGGLDLSKILDSARTRRQRQTRSNSQDTQEINQIMNRRMIVPPSDQMNQHHYTSTNPIQPFSYARQQPAPPRKHIQHDTDAITQSRSFQMLEGWISDSEKTVAALVPQAPLSNNSAVSRAIYDEQNNTNRRSSATGMSTLPSRSFRYLQEQYSTDSPILTTSSSTTVEEDIITTSNQHNGLRRSSDAHTPSRSFKFLQDQYPVSANRSQAVNNRDDLIEIYNKPPPSFREREPEAPRYSGSTVPSRSFRYLQMMTQDDEQTNSISGTGYTKPQQSLLNKYDEENLSANKNRFNEHPSRSFKYLQEMTGEQKSKDIGSSDF